MWYVLQTITGREEGLANMIKELVSQDLYEDCFVAYHERVWRKQGRSIVHVERMFPGYVFIVTDDPKRIFLELKHVPAMSKLLSDGESEFLPLQEGEEAFLQELLPGDRVARLSYVETDGNGRVQHVSGPLEGYLQRIVRYQFKKRYAVIRFQMLGVEKTAVLGIILREDVQQELAYGKVEAPVMVSEAYRGSGLPQSGALFEPGDHIRVTNGTLKGMEGIIWKVKKETVEIGVHLFGQDMSVEVSVEEIA